MLRRLKMNIKMRNTDFEKLKGKTKDGFFRKGQVGDWENFFTPELMKTFNEIAADTMKRAGYYN